MYRCQENAVWCVLVVCLDFNVFLATIKWKIVCFYSEVGRERMV